MFKSIAQSLIQDGATAAAGYFAAHGFITSANEQGFIGSVVFLAMLGVNAYLQRTQTTPPAVAAQSKGNTNAS